MQSCTVIAGWIDVLGNPPAALSQPEPMATNTLVMLLRANGPSVRELVERDYRETGAQSPLVGLRQGVLRVRPPHTHLAEGDYLRRLERAPESPEAKAERYIYADFESPEARDKALAALAKDAAVETVNVQVIQPIDAGPSAKPEKTAVAKVGGAGSQDFLDVLQLSNAWASASGWGLVAVLDNGLDTNNSQLRSFTGPSSVGGSRVVGGNYLPFLSLNVGGRQQPESNLEEL